MKTRLLYIPLRLWLAVITAGLLCACGVPVVDHEALQKENQELQKVVDQANAEVRQMQAQMLAQAQATQQSQTAVAQLQARLKEVEELLAQKEQELRTIQARFDKFKADRRSAMIGREYPKLRLADGKELQNARITAITDGELSIRHDAGVLKVALANSSEELRWEACFESEEEGADVRRRMLADMARLRTQVERDRQNSAANETVASGQRAAAEELRRTITAQRAALNNAYRALADRNPSALRGARWNSAAPETSGLINVFSERRAVLGIGELDSLAAAIKNNLAKLRELDSSGTR